MSRNLWKLSDLKVRHDIKIQELEYMNEKLDHLSHRVGSMELELEAKDEELTRIKDRRTKEIEKQKECGAVLKNCLSESGHLKYETENGGENDSLEEFCSKLKTLEKEMTYKKEQNENLQMLLKDKTNKLELLEENLILSETRYHDLCTKTCSPISEQTTQTFVSEEYQMKGRLEEHIQHLTNQLHEKLMRKELQCKLMREDILNLSDEIRDTRKEVMLQSQNMDHRIIQLSRTIEKYSKELNESRQNGVESSSKIADKDEEIRALKEKCTFLKKRYEIDMNRRRSERQSLKKRIVEKHNSLKESLSAQKSIGLQYNNLMNQVNDMKHDLEHKIDEINEDEAEKERCNKTGDSIEDVETS